PWNSPATVGVFVETPGGAVWSPTNLTFTYVAAPTVSGISLSSGNRDGLDRVSIYGANLDGATAVDFGPNAAAIHDESPTQIDVYSPAGSVGTVDVTVVAPGGSATLPGSFTYVQ